MSAISVLVVLGAFVNVSPTVLQRSIDQSGEPVGHRGNGFRGTELGALGAVNCFYRTGFSEGGNFVIPKAIRRQETPAQRRGL